MDGTGTLPPGSSVQLAIWDTAGQERFHALGPIYYRDADAALLVFDITDMDSFTRVKNWVKELRKMAGKDIVLVLAGNKVGIPPKCGETTQARGSDSQTKWEITQARGSDSRINWETTQAQGSDSRTNWLISPGNSCLEERLGSGT